MFEIPTKLDVAKKAVHFVVSANVAKFTKNVLTDHTDMNPDGIPVKGISLVTGELVASSLSNHTNALVEKTAAWLSARKEKNQNTPE